MGNVERSASNAGIPKNCSGKRAACERVICSPHGCLSRKQAFRRLNIRLEAPRVVPWFKEAYQGPAISTCKDRWIAIRKGNRTAYAQWEDAGPFRTDHWQYVFGNERPRLNLNKGAGLDVSPAVRDYLTLNQTDVTDWKFVAFSEVPRGPWSTHGENNTFVINDRKKKGEALAEAPKGGGGMIAR